MSFSVDVVIDDSKLQAKLGELDGVLSQMPPQVMSELQAFAYNTYREQVPVSEPRPG